MAREKTAAGKNPSKAAADSEATVIWSKEAESEDFIKVPRALVRLPQYLPPKELRGLKPRHILLLLALASRKYKQRPIRLYWEELGNDLGVKKDTVRKWAYELKSKGFLTRNIGAAILTQSGWDIGTSATALT